jgi:hypothetical protein
VTGKDEFPKTGGEAFDLPFYPLAHVEG